MPARRNEIGDLDRADLDHAMTARGIEPRRFSVENDLPHFSPEPRVKRFHDVSHLFARCVQTPVGMHHEIGAGAFF